MYQTPQPGMVAQTAYAQPAYAQPAYAQPAPAPAPVVVVSGGGGGNAGHANVYGQTSPTQIKCPSCGANTITRTKCEISQNQWLICIILCIVGCPCPCLPCYIPSCYRVHHNCSNCNHYCGVSK